MDLAQAQTIIARSVGDELNAFFGEPRTMVSEEALATAARVMLQILEKENPELRELMADVDEDTRMAMVLQQTRADCFEAMWYRRLDKWLTRPEKRAAVIAFIEERTGRPLALDNPDP
jgi:hypothetical protein